MNTNEQIPNLYLQGSGKSKLAINALDKIDTLTIIPLGLQLSKDGSVTFNLRDLEQWPHGVRLYLTDAETGINHDLQQNPKFTVALKRGTYENRFSLRCIPIKVPVNSQKNDDVFYVYRSNDATFIRIKLINDTQGTLVITNMAGRVVLRKTVNQNGDIELDRNISADGIFVASFQTQSGVYAKKFFW
jgi:hypothetical protein